MHRCRRCPHEWEMDVVGRHMAEGGTCEEIPTQVRCRQRGDACAWGMHTNWGSSVHIHTHTQGGCRQAHTHTHTHRKMLMQRAVIYKDALTSRGKDAFVDLD